ncbi:MAG: glycosyltransferase family 2 protein [Coleofasciculus sp. G3-WIS-01]|uniref:glycosyltransferase family 2 protein n=1 Tax=Coleofasciculus sp. G3-WIS-01 TaxID=3069528 RepID=UPI0032FC5E08
MTTISCIIVNYNKEKFLKQAIMSVVNQTMAVAEVIVADDGSTDGSRELITSLAHEYSQIKPIFREKNLGVAANRDLAIRAAKGELITTLDGDDWYLPQKIEKEFLALQGSTEAIAFSDVQLVRSEDEPIVYWDNSDFAHLNTKERLRCLAHWSGSLIRDMLIPKKLYIEAGGMQHGSNLYEDWDLQIRLAAYPNQWKHSGILGVNYRKTDSGLSTTNSRLRHIQAQYQILMSNQELLKEHIGELDFWLAMVKLIVRVARSALGVRSKLKRLRLGYP